MSRFLLTIIVITASLLTPTSVFATGPSLVHLVNAERQALRLKPLVQNPTLTLSALLKLNDMKTKNYFAHRTPSGANFSSFITLAGYKPTVAGENLARDFRTNEAMMKAFMASPTHKAVILEPRYIHIGVATGGGMTVLHFGAPQAARPLHALLP